MVFARKFLDYFPYFAIIMLAMLIGALLGTIPGDKIHEATKASQQPLEVKHCTSEDFCKIEENTDHE